MTPVPVIGGKVCDICSEPGAGNFFLHVNGLIISSPSFLIVNGGSPAERESGARAGPTPLGGKRGGEWIIINIAAPVPEGESNNL